MNNIPFHTVVWNSIEKVEAGIEVEGVVEAEVEIENTIEPESEIKWGNFSCKGILDNCLGCLLIR